MSNDYADEFAKKFFEGEQDKDAISTPVAAQDPGHVPSSDTNGASGLATLQHSILKEQIVLALKGVFDPEIPVNIYDLGLIYDVDVDNTGHVDVKMTLTTPGCPVAETFPGTVQRAVCEVEGVTDACVELVWDPPWTKDRMTEEALLELGMF